MCLLHKHEHGVQVPTTQVNSQPENTCNPSAGAGPEVTGGVLVISLAPASLRYLPHGKKVESEGAGLSVSCSGLHLNVQVP